MMSGEAMLFLFSVIMAGLLLFMMVFFVSLMNLGKESFFFKNLYWIGNHVFRFRM